MTSGQFSWQILESLRLLWFSQFHKTIIITIQGNLDIMVYSVGKNRHRFKKTMTNKIIWTNFDFLSWGPGGFLNYSSFFTCNLVKMNSYKRVKTFLINKRGKRLSRVSRTLPDHRGVLTFRNQAVRLKSDRKLRGWFEVWRRKWKQSWIIWNFFSIFH